MLLWLEFLWKVTATYAKLFILVDMEMLGCIFCSFLLNSYVTSGGSVNGFVFVFVFNPHPRMCLLMRERQTHRQTDIRCEKHPSVASRTRPDWGWIPQPLGVRGTCSSQLSHPARASECFLIITYLKAFTKRNKQ